ncbi:MAG TPA: spore germination protein [Pseudogracilibacillus sp.]|nr:spore germination protein [Pseudogracilibacillus sp.]
MTNKLKHYKQMYTTIKRNVTYIVQTFNETDDLVCDDFQFQKQTGKIIYLDTLTDEEKLDKMLGKAFQQRKDIACLHTYLATVAIETTDDLHKVVSQLTKGSCALFLRDENKIYLFDTPLETERSPEEPENERTIRGSHLGFVENLRTNIFFIRQRVKSEQLRIKYTTLGTESHRNIAIVYMNNLANKDTVKEIEKRVKSITIDSVFAPGFIEECIEEKPLSPFPQNLYTERPDRVEAHLMEGRIAVMSESSTDAIILPVSFFSFFQSPDDYNNRFYAGTVFRWFRLLSFFGTLLLPPLYIALVGFHFEIIPFELVSLVKSSIEGVPFPPFFEAIFMAVTVELIREAGIRLPSPIGETIGIVGGLIIGDAVVNAGLVSNVMVIVIALTAIMSFTIPSYELGNTVRILSLPIMISASMLGFAGIVLSFLFIVIHLCKMESFGVAYLSPLAPLHIRELADAIARFPIWMLRKRPAELRTQKTEKQGKSREWFYDEQ